MNEIQNRINKLNEVLEKAARNNVFPGATYALVCNEGKFYGCVGKKAIVPFAEENSLDTLYDMASCTKVICTTSCIFKLLEQGKIRLFDTVSSYLPRFKHEDILLWDLLTHTSGLPAGVGGVTKIKTREEALEKIYALETIYPKNTKIVYSDIGFVLLGLIVEKVSGMSLDKYAEENIFKPLEMLNTGYLPQDITRCAPTENRNDDIVKGMVRGFVHDELSYILGGVAGHAGLFSTCEDIEHFIEMVLNKGMYKGKKVFSEASIDLMFTPQVKENKGIALTCNTRGLGWIVQGDYCSAGDLASPETILHTGFTGTNVFIDRINNVGFTLLSNRVHPTRKNTLLIPFRGKLGNFIIANFGGRNNG